jgi:hypothetical protein
VVVPLYVNLVEVALNVPEGGVAAFRRPVANMKIEIDNSRADQWDRGSF